MAPALRVTILLACLNARQFLEPRIDPLLAQTFRDWEAIVLDSHSTDGSWEFFRSVASNDWRFRLYQIPREGVYAALNRGEWNWRAAGFSSSPRVMIQCMRTFLPHCSKHSRFVRRLGLLLVMCR